MNYSLTFKISLLFSILFLFFQIPILDAKKNINIDKSKIIVASVNGYKITMADIDFRLSLLSSAMKLRVKKNKKKFLESIVRSDLLFQEA